MKRKKSTTKKRKTNPISEPFAGYTGPTKECITKTPYTPEDVGAIMAAFDFGMQRENEEQKQQRVNTYTATHLKETLERLKKLPQLVAYIPPPEGWKIKIPAMTLDQFVKAGEPREVKSGKGALENLTDAMAAFGYALHSITHKPLQMNQQQTGPGSQPGTEKDREIYHLNKQLHDEKEWGAQALDMAHKALERAEYVTTQREELEKALAEEKRKNEWLHQNVTELEKQVKQQIERREYADRMRYAEEGLRKAGEERIQQLNEKLKAKKTRGRKR